MIVIFLGIVGALIVTYPALESGVRDISNGFREQNRNYGNQHGTALGVTNTTVTGTCISYNLTLEINNTGSLGINLNKLTIFDNGQVIPFSMTSTTTVLGTFYSVAGADGQITNAGGVKTVDSTSQNSQLTISTVGAGSETRSYVSFNTSSIPDDATVTIANVSIYAAGYAIAGESNPTWNVDYRMGKDVIGVPLTSGAYGNGGFSSAGSLNYGGIRGYKNFTVPSGRFSDISLTGQTDFELAPMWAGDMLPAEAASLTIDQTEYAGTSYDPFMMITYTQSVTSNSTILAPVKSINITLSSMSSSSTVHRVAVVTGNGITAYGTYACT